MKLFRNIGAALCAGALCAAALGLTGCGAAEVKEELHDSEGRLVGYGSYRSAGGGVALADFEAVPFAVEIPAQIDGADVTGIANNAFANDSVLSAVVLPDAAMNIGDRAFAKSAVKELYGTHAAFSAEALTDSDIRELRADSPEGVYFLEGSFSVEDDGNGGVLVSGFTADGFDVVVPDAADGKKVKAIGENAFIREMVTEVEIPASVTEIGSHAFYDCTKLDGISVRGSGAQAGMLDLANVKSIGEWAFRGCGRITDAALSDGLKSIATGSFSGTSLTQVSIPKSVTEIGSCAFNGCGKLSAITVEAGSRSFSDEDGVLFNKSRSEIVRFPEGKYVEGSYEIPRSVKTISEYAFYGSALSVDVPSSVSTVGLRAFDGCSSVTIPKTLREACAYAEGQASAPMWSDPSVYYNGKEYSGSDTALTFHINELA